MNVRVKNRLKRALQEELVKRLLVRYFSDKGLLESLIYPPAIYDMPYRVPELLNSVELVPFVDRMDPVTNVVTVGWNMFVLGTNRMNLGSSTHANLMEFKRSLLSSSMGVGMPSDKKKTAANIVEFIMNVVGRNENVMLELPPGARLPAFSQLMPPIGSPMPRLGATMAGSFYQANRPVY
jgi:hypothetical protein